MASSFVMSRRTLLHGTGVALALPWLEAMVCRPALAASTAKPPVRLAFFYVPNGVNMAHWKPSAPGKLEELPTILKPLEPLKQRILVLSDLAADHCNGKSAAHEPAVVGSWLARSANTRKSLKWVAHRSINSLQAKSVITHPLKPSPWASIQDIEGPWL